MIAPGELARLFPLSQERIAHLLRDGLREVIATWQLTQDHSLDLSGLDLSGCDLRHLRIGNVQGACLANADLTGATLGLMTPDAGQRGLADGVDLTEATLTGATVSDFFLRSARLARADLTNALIIGTTLVDADLSGARFDGCTLRHSHGHRCIFAGASFRRAALQHMRFERCSFQGCDWSTVETTRVALQACDLRSMALTHLEDHTHVEASDLRHARLSGKFHGCSFRSANLDHTDFTGADLLGADFRDSVGQPLLERARTHALHTDVPGGRGTWGRQCRTFMHLGTASITFSLPESRQLEVQLGPYDFCWRLHHAEGCLQFEPDHRNDCAQWLSGVVESLPIIDLTVRPHRGHVAAARAIAIPALQELLGLQDVDVGAKASEARHSARAEVQRNSSDERALVDDIMQHPEDSDRWRVYGDWLLDQGDPRGALIAMEWELRDDPVARKGAVNAWVQQHRAVVAGELDELNGVELAFQWGFLHRVTLLSSGGSVGACRQLSLAPRAQFLRHVHSRTAAKRVLPALIDLVQARPVVTLGLANTRFSGTTLLAHLDQLEQLDLGNTAVQDLHSLSSLHSLRVLNLYGAPVEDVRPLKSLHNLRELDLGSTLVTRIAPLARLPLERLNLGNTPVSDLGSLVDCPTLKVLVARCSRELKQTLRQANPRLKITVRSPRRAWLVGRDESVRDRPPSEPPTH